MVLRRGPFGMFMACPDYNADPPCKTFRKLSQKQQQKQSAPQPTGEDCPQCGKPLVLRQGAYGEFVSCSGYPKCKYIKQNIIEGMKCPKCGTGDMAERKAQARQHLLGLHELSQVRLHVELQARAAEVPRMRQPVPAREDAEERHLSRVPEQEEERRGRGGRAQEAGQKGRRAGAAERRGRATTRRGSANRRLRPRRRPTGRWSRSPRARGNCSRRKGSEVRDRSSVARRSSPCPALYAAFS